MRNFTPLPPRLAAFLLAALAAATLQTSLHAQSEWTYIKEFEYVFDPMGYDGVEEWPIEDLFELANGDIKYRNARNESLFWCWSGETLGLVNGETGELIQESQYCAGYFEFYYSEGWLKTHDEGFLEITTISTDQSEQQFNMSKTGEYGDWAVSFWIPPLPTTAFDEHIYYYQFGALPMPDGGFLVAAVGSEENIRQSHFDRYGNLISDIVFGDGNLSYTKLRLFHQTDSSHVYAFGNHFRAFTHGGTFIDSLTAAPLKQLKAANDGNLVALHDNGLAKYAVNGFANLWTHNYTQVPGATLTDFAKTPQGNFLITGGYQGDVLLLKTDSLGEYLWHQTFDFDTIGGRGNLIIETRDGGAVIAGDVGNFEDTRLGFIKKIAGVGDQYQAYISGNVYEDANEDCLPDVGEAALGRTIIQLKPEHRFTVANDSGHYDIGVNYGESYQLQAHPSPGHVWENACPPDGVHAFDMEPATDTTKHFGAGSIVFCSNELSVHISTPFHRRCAPNQHFIQYCNHTSATVSNAHVDVELPNDFFFMESSIEPSQQNGSTYTFDLPDMQPFECRQFTITDSIGCSFSLGVISCPNARLYLDQYCDLLEEDPVFEDWACESLIGSWDPNDKQVSPVGEGPQHHIEYGDTLTYKIRFQNVGTDTAFSVRVVDTLPACISPAGFRNIASSHNYSFHMSGNGPYVANWHFTNIALPDSAANPLGSIGFVEFELRAIYDFLNPLLPPECYEYDGLLLENTAHIRFDANPYIATNTVFNTFGQEEALPVTLLSFGGGWMDGKRAVQLQWATAEEVNAATFSPQRSPDGERFETLAELPAKGTGNGIARYGYVDENPPNNAKTLYYRLLQTDLDGTQNLSKTIAVNPSGELGGAPKVFASPAGGMLHVLNAPAGSQLKLFNASGRTLMNLPTAQTAIDASHLPTGIYFYLLQSPGGAFWTGKVWR